METMYKRLRSAVAAVLAQAALLVPSAWADDVVLLMAEEAGCIWCARWNADVSTEYPKTAEGRAAPLHRIDIDDARRSEFEFAMPLRFTPTFVLMRDGVETGRIEGYPGEDFFWGLLGRLLDDAEVPFREPHETPGAPDGTG